MNRPNGNYEHDYALYVSQFAKLETAELQALLAMHGIRRPTPWQRQAIRRVLAARGEKV